MSHVLDEEGLSFLVRPQRPSRPRTAHRPGAGGLRPRPRRACRPRVTMLEGRVVPSTLTVTSSADDGSAHTLRWAVDNAQSGDTIQITAAVKDPIDLMQGELY